MLSAKTCKNAVAHKVATYLFAFGDRRAFLESLNEPKLPTEKGTALQTQKIRTRCTW